MDSKRIRVTTSPLNVKWRHQSRDHLIPHRPAISCWWSFRTDALLYL